MENEPYYSSGYDIYLHRSFYGKTGTYDSVSIGDLLSEGAITVGGVGEATIGEGSIDIGKFKTMPSILGWIHTISFSASDADTVAWSAGAITLSDGTVYNIAAGNTGNITARTYIYLDTGSSLTVLQTTTTASSAVGSGKILVATAIHGTEEANFFVFSGSAQNVLNKDNLEKNTITANEIFANTIGSGQLTTGEFVTNTANIKDAIVTSAKVTALDATKITTGTLVVARTQAKCTDATADKTSTHTAADTAKVQGNTIISGGYIATSFLSATNIQAGTLRGRDVISALGTTYIKLATGNYLQFVRAGAEKGRIWSDDSGDIYIRGTDDVVFNAGNAARCGAYSDSFKPVAGGYDLGKDNVTNRFDWVFANYYSSQGHTGEQGNYEFMTKLRLDLNASGEVKREAGSYYEKKAVTIWGGIVTTVGATQTVAHGTFLT